MAKQTDHIGDTKEMVTAVEWLIEQLQAPCRGIPSHIVEQAKQMHKEQIINAWLTGETFLNDDNDSMYSPDELRQEAEAYYDRTFKIQ